MSDPLTDRYISSLDIRPSSDAWMRAEEIWSRVIELEEAFWPSEEEIETLKIL